MFICTNQIRFNVKNGEILDFSSIEHFFVHLHLNMFIFINYRVNVQKW